MNRVYKITFIAIFLVILLTPLSNINMAERSDTENRRLALVPQLWVENEFNKKFCNDAESWLKDRFWGRDALLFASRTYAAAVADVDNENVLVGKDGWLFYKGSNSIENYQNKNLFTAEQLEIIKNNTIAKKELLAKKGISYYLLICPDKNRIYGEYYPESITKKGSQGRAEQLVEYLRANNVDVIYPLEEMLAEKERGTLYHRLDTHWNFHGSFVGYTALMKAIKQDYPSLNMLTDEDFIIRQVEESKNADTKEDLLEMIGVPRERIWNPYPEHNFQINNLEYRHNNYSYKVLESKGRHGRDGVVTKNESPLNYNKVYVMRDSFSIYLIPYISESFFDVHYIWTSDFGSNIEKIIKANPQIVIEEKVERFIPELIDNINK